MDKEQPEVIVGVRINVAEGEEPINLETEKTINFVD
jgi:hypothetical protein